MKRAKTAEILARGTHCQVNQDKGTIHLSIGPCTMRLAPQVFYSVYESLGEAVEQMIVHERERVAPLTIIRGTAEGAS